MSGWRGELLLSDKLDKRKKRIFMAVTFVLVFLICFGLPEMFLRKFKPRQTYSRLTALVKAGIYTPGDFIPFTLKANTKTQTLSQEHFGEIVTAHINSLGLRGPEIELNKPEGVTRILVLGDSYTYGVFVNDHETYCAVFQELLRKEGHKVEVINAGYADGWGPQEHYAWLMNRGLKFDPDIIVYGFFIGNDIGAKTGQWARLDERGLPTKIVNDDIYVDEEGIIRSKLKDEKTVGHELIYRLPLLRESHLLVFLFNRLKINQIFTQSEPKNPKGWGEQHFPFILQAKSDEEMLKREKIFKKLVKGLADMADEHNKKFLLLMIPINFQVEEDLLPIVLGTDTLKIQRNYFDELAPWLKQQKTEYLDLLKAMKTGEGKYYPRNGEVHFNPRGHQFTALQLKLKFDRLGWL